MQKEDELKDRLLLFIDYLGISQRTFEGECGLGNGTISNIKKGLGSVNLEKIINAYPELNIEWLISGKGRMLKDIIQKIGNNKCSERIEPEQEVILYDVAAAANLSTLFCNRDQNILGKISIPDMPRCDGAVYVTGDSMYPLLKSGDIVIYKEINEYYNIIFGEMYLISFDLEGDEYLTVKYINKGSDSEHVKLISYNEHFSPMEIPINAIRALAIVKMSIRKNTML